MRKLNCLILVVFLLSIGLAFGGAKAEDSAKTAAPQAKGSLKPEEQHPELYELADWEKKIGKKLAFKESPVIAAEVKAGKLPPVEKRLPDEPMVIKPPEMIGTYGGLWQHASLGRLVIQFYLENDESLFTRDMSFRTIYHNIIKSSKASDDQKTITFYLRKGMKWSDGHLFTADDFLFYWNDLLLNKEFTPIPDNRFVRGGEPGIMTRVDDYAVSIAFKLPYGGLIDTLACPYPPNPYAPAHYLKQFHPKYTDKAELDKKIKDAGFKTWSELMLARNDTFGGNSERPFLGAWIPMQPKTSPVVMYKRNPYYWKVDTEGNQLPYIEEIEDTRMNDRESIVLAAIAGKITYQREDLDGAQNLPVLSENAAKGNYQIVPYQGTQSNHGTVFFNFFHEDPVLRDLFLNKNFRIALSYAINRKEISDIVYKGTAAISNVSASSETDWFVDAYAKRYTEYDVAKANKMLDDLGLKWDSAKEFRARPDGKRLVLELKLYSEWPVENKDNAEFIRKYWKAVGIDLVIKPTASSLWGQQIQASQFDLALYSADFGFPSHPPYLSGSMFPTTAGCYWGIQWYNWLATNGKAGVEPPASVKQLFTMANELPGIIDQGRRNQIIMDALKIHDDNFWMVGCVREPNIGRYFVIKNNIGNAFDSGWAAYRTADLKFPYAWSTFFFKK